METNENAPAVAVLGLPDLAEHLADRGLDVVTGPSFRAAASATNTRLKTGPVPVLMADVAVPGTTPWVEKTLRACPAVLVGVDLGEGQKRVGGNTTSAVRLDAPIGIDDLLAELGLPAVSGGGVLGVDGSVTGAQAPAPADVAEPEHVAEPVVPEDAEADHAPEPSLSADESDPAEEIGTVTSTQPAPVDPEPAETEPTAPVQITDTDDAELAALEAQVVDTATTVPTVPVAPVAPMASFWDDVPTPPAPVTTPTPAVPAGDDLWDDAPTQPQAAPPASELDLGALDEPTDVDDEPVPPPTPQLPREPARVHVTEPAPTAAVAEVIGEDAGYSPALGKSLAPVIASVAGKGGVGKTSIAFALAQRAAVVGQMRTVLVDGNRGQGDLRTYLSLTRSGLPTIYDAATTGDPKAAIVTPDRLAANRPPSAERLEIALVQAPPRGLADTTVITAGLYHDVIAAARTMADLVIIDTQIVEGAERGMFDELIIPMLASHAWAVGIADLSRPGVDNLIAHLGEFVSQGVPPSRLMTMLNRVPATTAYDLQKTSEALSRFGHFLAAVPADPEVHSAMAYGTSIYDNPALAPVLDQVLLRVTGNDAFAHTPAPQPTEAVPARRRLFGRRR